MVEFFEDNFFEGKENKTLNARESNWNEMMKAIVEMSAIDRLYSVSKIKS